MSDREMIHNYLQSLMRFLSRLDREDADDVLREIESHIYDVMEMREENGQIIDASAILEGFGQPRDLASQYVDHILKGAPPPRGFKAIQSVKRGATSGLRYATALVGYVTAATLIIVGLYKLIDPDAVGFWANESGESVVIGALTEVPAGTHELMGWWLTPVALGIGIAAAYLTSRLLRVLKLKS
ncbi:hypothetical protein [Parasphingorhabdus sp.]|uniref:HAAS signaling domain-containing protein n=1 Tax=Parasphingorhabdus sp. TaxID=2709688 RepID=UPI003267E13B